MDLLDAHSATFFYRSMPAIATDVTIGIHLAEDTKVGGCDDCGM